MKRLAIILLAMFYMGSIYSQKVGLVLSGGGAKGMAHVGVLKALEESGIPINYVAGTSMGAIVGGLYASGYSLEEMDSIFSCKDFTHWIKGTISDEYIYYFKKEEPNSAWLRLDFNIESAKFTPRLPVNLLSPSQMDFGFVEIFTRADAIAQGNFDSLFVPFRCIGTDITNSKEAIFSDGCLKDAIRASMTFPFVFRPIKINGNMMYDGGMINNFPVDVMEKDFAPDYIIAVAVSKPNEDPSDDDFLSIINSMLMAKQFYNIDSTKIKGIVIRPNVPNLSVTDFDRGRELVEVGYKTMMDSMHIVREFVKDSIPAEVIANRRTEFQAKCPTISINNVETNIKDKSRNQIVENLFFETDSVIDMKMFKKKYFSLISEKYINHIYPTLYKNADDSLFQANLFITFNKPFQIQFGGYITTNTQTTFYVKFGYNFWKRYFMSANLEAYFGQFYNSALASFKISSLGKQPMEQTFSIGIGRWNYLKTSWIFTESDNPSFLTHTEGLASYQICTPAGRKAKFGGQFNFVSSKAKFFSTNDYSHSDTSDINKLMLLNIQSFFEYNTQDFNFFPTKGSRFLVKLDYFFGVESNNPGNTSSQTNTESHIRDWFSIKLEADHTFDICKPYSLTLSSQFAWSNIPRLESFTATKLRCNAFTPTHESQMFYTPFYRDPSFITIGLSNVFNLYKNLQLRISGYYYQPFFAIVRVGTDRCDFSKCCELRSYILYGSLAYTTKIGPISANISYYGNNDPHILFNISFGYLFFNKRIF